ncbi:oligosaccharide flippase family protein [Noviherbaspirillum sedimenti]|uniref:Polysaccharide biosynthesis protein C-terminal domain-containing protein n=1 Tax=Noviherbaspirillum sedimenti TaxID=2320865 RepID=A0A3A3G0C9_9BURK|nr:oligosaccharide flippase family protein [Noviherbaspirillum sedimenti]RJG01897.1 hypothetical protein D3878_10160 [Noviherbaspirillum sedimenti]
MRRNLVISFMQKHVQMLIGIASVITLSRLISPEETGVFSVGVAITAITHALRDFGVGNFLVKEAEMTSEKANTAFTVSLLIAVSLSVILLVISGPLGSYYANPEITTIIYITTLGLLISPFSTVSLALMLRDQRFIDMFKVSVAGSVANAVVAIFLAWIGMGAKALALGALVSSIAIVLVANLLWRDLGIYRLSLVCWRRITQFGLHMTAFGVAEQLGQRASDLIVGKVLGFSSVGLLSRSGTLTSMVQESVLSSAMPVVLTSMAGDQRKSGDVSQLLLRSIEYFSVITWPLFAVLSIFAHDAVLVLFGQKWLEAAPYTSMLCYGACFAALSSLVGTTCNATGRVDLLSRYGIIAQGIRVAMVAAGAMTGSLQTVVLFLVATEAIQCALAYFFVRRTTSITIGQVIQRSWKSLAVTGIVVSAMIPIDVLVNYHAIIRLAIVAVTATMTWIAAIFLVRHPISTEFILMTTMLTGRFRTLMFSRKI